MLSYYCRSREREVDNGKYEEDLSDYLVPSHLRGMCMALIGQRWLGAVERGDTVQ